MIPAAFKIHDVTIQVRRRSGAYGDTFDTPITVKGFAQTDRSLVRSATGEEVVSSATVWLDPDVTITEGSKVTVLGRTSQALAIGVNEGPGGALNHQEVRLK